MHASVEDVVSVQQFLYREAALLDQGRHREWLDMLSDRICYVLPVLELLDPKDQTTPGETFRIFDDDKASLELRVSRYETGHAHAEAPRSVTHRMVSNIEVVERMDANMLVVASAFAINQERLRHNAATFLGRRRDVLERSGSSWLIVERRIELAQSILPSTISIFF